MATWFTASRALAQQLGGAVHADLLQVGAEAGLAGLGERALELAAGGGHPAGDVVQRELGVVLGLDDRGRLVEQGAPALRPWLGALRVGCIT